MRLLLNFVSLRSGMSQKLSQSPTKSIVVSWPWKLEWYQPPVGSRSTPRSTKKKERMSKEPGTHVVDKVGRDKVPLRDDIGLDVVGKVINWCI